MCQVWICVQMGSFTPPDFNRYEYLDMTLIMEKITIKESMKAKVIHVKTPYSPPKFRIDSLFPMYTKDSKRRKEKASH